MAKHTDLRHDKTTRSIDKLDRGKNINIKTFKVTVATNKIDGKGDANYKSEQIGRNIIFFVLIKKAQ